MIEIKLLDKNNQELTNGDTIRFVEIRPTYDSPFSDNSYQFQDGIVVKFVEFKVDAQADIDEGDLFCIPRFYYTKEDLLEICCLSKDTSYEEYMEDCVYYICSELGIKFTTEVEFFNQINGFTIVKTHNSGTNNSL